MAGKPEQISLGAGTLKCAPIGTTEPTTLSTAWDAAWVDLGYTEEGSEFEYGIETSEVEVAEELDPILYATVKRTGKLSFSLAQVSAANLSIAFNGGTITTGTGIVTFDPPAIGTEVRRMIGFQSEDGEERWIWRQCLQGGAVAIGRKKAPDKALLPVEFMLEKPAGLQPWRAILDDARED